MMKKQKTEPDLEAQLPPLSLAVKRVREHFQDSQEAFAHRIGIASMTLSRFERGLAEPKDPRVLKRLISVVNQRLSILPGGFYEEHPIRETLKASAALFLDALQNAERQGSTDLESPVQPAARSLSEWRLLCIARVAALYFPEQAAAMEKAAPGASALLNEVLSRADKIDYARFEREVFALAEERAFQSFKQGKKETK